MYISLPHNQPETTNNMIDNALATVVHASRCSVNHTMKTFPGAMIFSRDMMINVPFISDLIAIGNKKQQLVNENTRRVNARSKDKSQL